MRLSLFKTFFKKKKAWLGFSFFLYLSLLAILPFLDGGFSLLGKFLLLSLPLPLFLFTSGKKFFLTQIHLFFGLFLLSQLFSIPGSASLSLSVPAFFQYLAYFLFLILFVNFEQKNKLKWVSAVILLVAFGLSCWHLAILIFKLSPPESLNLVYARHGHSHLVDYLLFAFPLSLSCFLASQNRRLAQFWGLLTAFYFFNFLLTFSRMGFLILAFCFFWLFLWFQPKRKKKLFPVGAFFIFLLALLSFFLLVSRRPEIIENQVLSQWLRKQIVKPTAFEKRLEYWYQALMVFAKKPILGSGIGTFEIASLKHLRTPFIWSRFTHNFFLQVLSESGLLGFLSFILLVVYILRFAFRLAQEKKNSPWVTGSFFALLLSFTHSLFDFDWHFPAIFLTFLTLFLALADKKEKKLVFSLKKGKTLKRFFVFLWLFLFLFSLSFAYRSFYLKMSRRSSEEKAKKYFRLLTFIYPWDKEELQRGVALFLAPEEIKGFYRKMVFFNRSDPSIYTFSGQYYYALKNWEKAADGFERAIKLNPLGGFSLYPKLEKAYDQLGWERKKKELYLLFAKAIDKDWLQTEEASYEFKKKAADFFYKLALIEFEDGDFKQAFDHYFGAYQTEPWVLDRFEPLPVLGQGMGVLESFTNVIFDIDLFFAGKHRPYYAKIFYFAGKSYFPDEPEKTLRYWQKAVLVCPEYTAFALDYGHLCLNLGRYGEAEDVFEECLSLHPDDSGGCDLGLEMAKENVSGYQPGSWEGDVKNEVSDSF